MKPVRRSDPEYRDTVKGHKADIKTARKTGASDDLVLSREELHTTRVARTSQSTTAYKERY